MGVTLRIAPVVLGVLLAARASPAQGRPSPVLRVLDRVARSLRATRYSHATRVDEARGRYDWDCSGMAAWVLARATPAAERAVERARRTRRPLARDYHAYLAGLAPGGAAGPWARVPRLADAQPGDVVAWVFPPWVPAAITGHVAFVVARPVPVRGAPGRYRVRIADATSVPHADDTRAGGRSGFGYGTIELAVDARTGAAVAYRWNDLPGRGTLRTSIVVARPRPGG